MIWHIDNTTQIAARSFPFIIYANAPLPQDQGGNFFPSSWTSKIRPTDAFPSPPLTCSPNQIIAEFQAQRYLQALAFTICWGGMWRRNQNIYSHALQYIYDVLDQCAQSIRQTQDIQQSWDLLTNQLLWSNVMASKALHFLCRALGQVDPPVAIDNAVILDKVWPAFRIGVPPKQRPQDWDGNSFSAYSRYMTAIIEWAHMKNWTTTEVECTIYAENQ